MKVVRGSGAEMRTLLLEYMESWSAALSSRSWEVVERFEDIYGAGALMATNEEEALGCVCVKPSSTPRWVELKHLYVRPEYRRHGIAKQLLEAALSHARHAGAGGVRLDVDISSTGAIELYESLGFTQCEPFTEGWDGALFYERAL